MNVFLSKKYKFLKIIVLVTVCFWGASLQANNQANTIEDVQDDAFGDFIINLDDVPDIRCDLANTTPPDLGQVLLALTLIKCPLWQHTKAPVGRDILYLLPYKITALEYGGFACNLFFNMTNKMQVDAGNLLQIESAIDQQQLLNFLEVYFENASPSDISGLIPLFKKMTIQERKGGLFFQGGLTRGPCTIQINTSLQAAERNFWVNKRDQQDIRTLIQNITGQQDAAFDDSEGLRVRYGMGDTRLKLGINTINVTSLQLDFGIESILPTSRFSHTPKLKSNVGPVNTVADLQNSAVSILRSVRDYLLSPNLGIGHYAVGCYMESKMGIFHDTAQWWMRLSYDKFFPGKESRLIMVKPTVCPLTPEEAGKIPDDKQSEFIEKFLMQYVFPPSFKVEVDPGGIFNFVTSLSVDFSRCWCYAIGYDFYAQQEEQITKICSSMFSPADLRVNLAESVSARQHKIFTELMYYLKKQDYADMSIGAGGDLTVASAGIGRDWTVYLKFAASF